MKPEKGRRTRKHPLLITDLLRFGRAKLGKGRVVALSGLGYWLTLLLLPYEYVFKEVDMTTAT